MHIVADENIPALAEFFGDLGTITSVDGRRLGRDQLRDADILLVRSVTRVDAALLDQTSVRYVGTATAGIDHIDTDYLAARGIHFASAPGCNSTAVAEYIVACVLAYCLDTAREPGTLTAAVIGCGHAGTAVARLLSVLGVRCVLNDPPRAAREGSTAFCSWSEALEADVVTLHVPLSRGGEWATVDLLDADKIAQLSSRTLVINAARGGVFNESAWLRLGAAAPRLVLDCWCNEPRLNLDLLERCWIATPHIAGHTQDARLTASRMLATALRRFLEVAAVTVSPTRDFAPSPVTVGDYRSPLAAIAAIVTQACDPISYTRQTRELRSTSEKVLEVRFDELRAAFGRRREVSVYRVGSNGLTPAVRGVLETLGFGCDP